MVDRDGRGPAGGGGRVERLGHGAHVADRHAHRVQRGDPLLRRALAQPACQHVDQRLAVLDARGVGGEALVGAQLLAPDRPAERAEEPVVGSGDRDPAGRGLEVLVRHDVGVSVPEPPRRRPRDERVLRDVDEPREGAVEQRHLDAPALAALERREDGGRRVQTGKHVDERHADLVRLAVLGAGDRHQAALGLDDEVVAGAAGGLAPGAEPADRAVDDARVARADRVVAHAEPVGAAELEVLDHDVRASAQLERERPTLGIAEVEGAAALAAVDREVVRRLAAGERRAPRAGLVAALGPLDLDDVGAEVGEQHRAVRARRARATGPPRERPPAGRRG